MASYERDNIARLTAYVPGEQPQIGRWIKLNTNENPYPPAPAVRQAIRQVSADQLRRYPPPNADAFCQTAARLHRVNPSQIIATNGGDELLRLVVTVFARPNLAMHPCLREAAEEAGPGGIAIAEPSYSLYPVLADIHESTILRLPLCEDWSLPHDFAVQAKGAGCKLAMIVNPHAPSGHVEPLERLRDLAQQLAQAGCVLLIDEAYVNFAKSDCLPLVRRGSGLDNVLLLRSLSKGYSLAGLRFGYGIGHPDLIASLQKAKDSYPTDILAQTAAQAALQARAYAAETWHRVVMERRRLIRVLGKRGWTIPPSGSNFILAAPPAHSHDARAIYHALKQQAIFVRYFDQDRLRDKLRITIGTPTQNNRLLWALKAMKV